MDVGTGSEAQKITSIRLLSDRKEQFSELPFTEKGEKRNKTLLKSVINGRSI
jgi:hypothetical protein